MNKSIHDFGHLFKTENINILFSNKCFKTENNQLFEKENIIACRQKHTNIMSNADQPLQNECDAIYIKRNQNKVLQIKTADCLPIFTFSNEFVFAIHAGWRGLSSKIIYNLKKFSFAKNTPVVIGPHIQHYEVNIDVVDEILDKNKNLATYSEHFITSTSNNKYLINLSQLACLQLQEIGFNNQYIFISDVSTLSNEHWHSYRREQTQSGRNLSFIYENQL